ncbi:hypothetical protein METP3_00131 [Methanosarcinales archaeon]|nr:hypothetical protein METP3_00131 [Methanosarcinales archaeon]
MYKIIEDDEAIANIDLMFAIVLVMAAVIMALLVMPNLSHEDRSWRIEQYMTAVRASDNLVQDEGQEGWIANWTALNYSNVTKIGFVYAGQPKVLDRTKIDTMMAKNFDDGTNETGLPWWEFPNFTKQPNERKIEVENATRALGLDGYNLYMRLYPVGQNTSEFNYSRVDINLTNRSKVTMIENTASMVDRYIYINSSDPLCKGGNLCYDGITVHYRLNIWVW